VVARGGSRLLSGNNPDASTRPWVLLRRGGLFRFWYVSGKHFSLPAMTSCQLVPNWSGRSSLSSVLGSLFRRPGCDLSLDCVEAIRRRRQLQGLGPNPTTPKVHVGGSSSCPCGRAIIRSYGSG
jgi:hypothetical protein